MRHRLFFLIFFLFLLFTIGYRMDNDTWYLLALGRAIESGGIPVTDPLLQGADYPIVIQQWLYALGLWKIYVFGGQAAIYAASFLIGCTGIYFYYKLCMLASDQNVCISAILATFMGFIDAVALNGITERPQTVSTTLLIASVLILESVAKSKRTHLLLLLLPISLALINLHAAIWPMLPILMLPYLAESFLPIRRFPYLASSFLREAILPRMTLLMMFFGVFLLGFLNPYGFQAMAYSTLAQGIGSSFHWSISEMRPLNALNLLSYFVFLPGLLLLIHYARQPFYLRHLLLSSGTFFMACYALRSSTYFLMIGTFPLAIFYANQWKTPENLIARFRGVSLHFVCLCLLLGLSLLLPPFFSERGREVLATFPSGMNLAIGMLFLALLFLLLRFWHTRLVHFVFALLFSLFIACLAATRLSGYLVSADQQDLPTDALNALINDAAAESPEKILLYTDFQDATLAEFYGFHPYIDTRPEMYASVIPDGENRWQEYTELQTGTLYYEDFLQKHAFAYVLVSDEDILYTSMDHTKTYTCIFDDGKHKVYRLKEGPED